jgi:pimeloyl-ACP methyl ester carboxylesterase
MEFSAYHPFRSAKARDQFLLRYDLRAAQWPVALECRTLETTYGPTFMRISGPVDAPPLVLLHGASGNSLHWLPNVEAWSQHYRVYAVDNIHDCGRSVYTRALTRAEDFARWLDDLVSGLEPAGQVNLVGLSYGGWIAAQYALRFPDRLRKIALLAPVGTVLPLSAAWMLRAILCAIPHRYFTRSFMYWLLDDLARKDEASRRMLDEWVEDAFLATRCFKSKRMVNPTVLTDEQLRSIRLPTLYLVGENEKIYAGPHGAREAVGRLNNVAPHIETEIIPHAGHDLTMVQADLVNREVLDFLR